MYHSLEYKGYHHDIVIHEEEFTTINEHGQLVHTNSIEGWWGNIKAELKRMRGTSPGMLPGHPSLLCPSIRHTVGLQIVPPPQKKMEMCVFFKSFYIWKICSFRIYFVHSSGILYHVNFVLFLLIN